MFKCSITGKLSSPGDKCNKIVVAKRERVYTRFFRNEDTGKWEELEVGRGWEIVREINACDSGVELWNSWSDSDKQAFVQNI